MGTTISEKKVSSYQRLKERKASAELLLSQYIDDVEHMIEYPYSTRAQGFRREIKIKLDLL